jgi:CubicO group peptidase (beta-lactamase class C family)
MRIALWLLLSTLAFAQAPSGTDTLVQDLLRDWQVPGLALAIVHNGAIVHQKGYGIRDVENKLPVTTQTAFAYGSITKSLTALLLHSLATEGKLDWDAPVRDQLPGFKLADAVASERATPRDLVSHRTGLPRHDAMWAGLPQPPSQAELLARLRYLPASADFRTTYQYNNLMFLTAGLLGAHAAGTTWEQAVHRRVLEPLGLNAIAATRAEAAALPQLAESYSVKDKTFQKLKISPGLDSIAPAGASAGSIEDLTRYLQAHMDKGLANGRQALPAAYFDAMQTPHTPMPATGNYSPFTAPQAYGMALFLGQYEGRRMVYHTGTIGGYHAMMWWLPEEKLGIAVLLNRVERAVPHILCLTLASRILGTKETDWNAVYKQHIAPPPAPLPHVEGTSPGHPLSHYAGAYHHPAYGLVIVTETPTGLALDRSGAKLELKHWHYDTFAAARERVSFSTNADGKVAALRMKLEPAVPEIEFTRR